MMHDRSKYAQLTVLEAVVSIGIIFLTMVFVYQQMTAPVAVSSYSTSQLKILCDDALYQMWKAPSSKGYSNLLTELILENNTDGFVQNMSSFLPVNVFYNVWIYDGLERSLWYPYDKPNEPTGNIVVSHQIIVTKEGKILSVEMEAWEV